MNDKVTPTKETRIIDQPYEAGFSTNFFLNHPKMGRQQFTFRGATSGHWGEVMSDLHNFIEHMSAKGWTTDGDKPAEIVPPSQPQELTRQPIDDSGNDLPTVKRAVAGRLSFDVKDGKTYYKIMDATFAAGNRGTKYGVTVWPETLTAAGLELVEGQPAPDLNGWTFEYVENEKGYPQKVTRLLPK